MVLFFCEFNGNGIDNWVSEHFEFSEAFWVTTARGIFWTAISDIYNVLKRDPELEFI